MHTNNEKIVATVQRKYYGHHGQTFDGVQPWRHLSCIPASPTNPDSLQLSLGKFTLFSDRSGARLGVTNVPRPPMKNELPFKSCKPWAYILHKYCHTNKLVQTYLLSTQYPLERISWVYCSQNPLLSKPSDVISELLQQRPKPK